MSEEETQDAEFVRIPVAQLRGFDPTRTWFTSDTHYGHARILQLCDRPFASVEEMDETLVRNWNARVGQDDHVFHLGDFAFRNSRAFTNYRRRLNGRIHLVWGNHDSEDVRASRLWETSSPFLEVRVGSQDITLCHYGMRVWNASHNKAIHLYGHSHDRLPGDSGSCDVGVDNPAWSMSPVRLEDILRHLRGLPERPRFGGEREQKDRRHR